MIESIVDLHDMSQNAVYLFDWFDSLRPGQQFFSYDGTGLSVLNQHYAEINVSYFSKQRSAAGNLGLRCYGCNI